MNTLSSKELEAGRTVKIMIVGCLADYTAKVTLDKDKFDFPILEVIGGPKGSVMLGARLKGEDYIPMEYVEPAEAQKA